MDKRVLVIGPNYFNYLKASASAFERCGYTVVTDAYDTPVHPYTTIMKWRYKFCNREKLQKQSIENYNRHLTELFNKVLPQIVFIMNGEIILPSTLDYFRKSSKVAVWLYDSLDKLPGAKSHADHVDAMCCFEQEDVNYYKNQGKHAYFLPQACDTDTYHPVDADKVIDISFVGHIYYSPKRKETLNAIIKEFPNSKIVVYGLYQPWFKGIWKWITREHKDVYKNCMIPADRVNELYNSSKVVLNIHQESQKQGANPRTFEIIGSGAYQVCDANPYIEELFTDGEIGVYHNFDEMFELIRKALVTDKSETIAKAREYVLANHSFDRRIEKVIEWLETENKNK